MSSARIVCLSRALSPITHMAGSVGNEALIARESVRLPDGSERRVPTLSGNAMRHAGIRSPGMRWLIGEYELAERLTLPQLNFLFHGGSLTESTGRDDTKRLAEMMQTWPLLRLLGGCLPDQIIQGSLRVSSGVLCCEENRLRLEAILGQESMPKEPLIPAEQMVKQYEYSTFDAKGHEADLVAQAVDVAGSKSDPRMRYVGQSVQPGAYFAHDYTLMDPTTVEVGCVLWSLSQWQESGGVIGGMGAKGHGRLYTRVVVDGYDAATCVNDYLRRSKEMQERAVTWLMSAFSKAEKPAKPKGRPKKAEPEAVA